MSRSNEIDPKKVSAAGKGEFYLQIIKIFIYIHCILYSVLQEFLLRIGGIKFTETNVVNCAFNTIFVEWKV